MKEIDPEALKKVLIVIFTASLFVTLGILIFYFHTFNGPVSNDQSHWGSFGDFLGGVLNPIFGLFSLLALLLTLVLQNNSLGVSNKQLINSNKELELTRIELSSTATALKEQQETMKLQAFESTFFQLLNLHHNFISTIAIADFGDDFQKRNSFKKLFENFIKAFIISGNNGDHSRLSTEVPIIVDAFRDFSRQYEPYLGNYFTNVFNMIKFLDKSDISNKLFYSDLIKSQFSKYELLLLFYYSIDHHHDTEYNTLMEKYSFFVNLDRSKLRYPIHLEFYRHLSTK